MKPKKSVVDIGDDETLNIKINEDYAKKYEHRKKREELSKLKEQYGDVPIDGNEDEDSEEEEDEDDVGELDLPEWDNQFLKLLPKIATKNPEIYEKKEYFPEPAEGEKEKPVYLKDYVRKTLLETEGRDYNEAEELRKLQENMMKDTSGLSLVEEQEKIKKDILGATETIDESEDDNFFSLRSKSNEEIDEENKSYEEFKIKNMDSLQGEPEMSEMDLLKRYWQAKELTEGDKFLRDYILNKGWIDKNEVPTYDEVMAEIDNEDDAAIEKQAEFEQQYNHRFEEEGGTEIKTYPRNSEDSLRRKDSKRKLQRDKKKQRISEEKVKKQEELKRLKNLKKQEILEKLAEIENITGVTGFSAEELDKDWDPEEFDKKMNSAFNDQFYSKAEYQKPQPLDEEIDDVITDMRFDKSESESEDSESESESESIPRTDFSAKSKPLSEAPSLKNNIIEAPDGYEENLNSLIEEVNSASKKQKKKKARSLFKQLRSKLSDSGKKKLAEMLDEYYKLDYEDLIAGEIPTRFKYTKVRKGTFGLSLDEILSKEERELNEKVSIKKYAPYVDLYPDRKRKFVEQYKNFQEGNPRFQNSYKKQKKEQTPEPPRDPNKKTSIRDRKKRLKAKKKGNKSKDTESNE